MDLHEFGFTRGRRGGGDAVEGVHLSCPVVLHRFVDICQQVFGLFFTYDTTCNGGGGGGGGGGGQLLPEGWHFICHGGGGGSCPPPHPPTPKAMLDPGRLIVSTEG